jgi:hypothetical protein
MVQFAQVGAELLFAGKQKWAEVQAVFSQLVSDLTSHTGSASQIVQAAIDKIQGVLKPQNDNAKRGLVDYVTDKLGLTEVWGQITSVGSSLLQSFINTATRVVFAGRELFNKVCT